MMTTDEKKLFEVIFMKDQGIVRFVFSSFTRQTIDQWAEYVYERNGKLRSPMRSLYDFTHVLGLPTPYLNQTTTKVMNEIQIPDDTRTAYLVTNALQLTYYRLLKRRMPKRVGLVEIFLTEADAIAWLVKA